MHPAAATVIIRIVAKYICFDARHTKAKSMDFNSLDAGVGLIFIKTKIENPTQR